MSLETFKNGIKHRGFRFPKKHPRRVDGPLCFVGLGLFLMSEAEKRKKKSSGFLSSEERTIKAQVSQRNGLGQ